MEKIIISSDNAHKISELEYILKDLNYQLISKTEGGFREVEVEEDEDTLEENALKKARAISKLCNYKVIADDTGLFVNALDGEPGVHSARYASILGEGRDHSDRDNVDLVLKKLKDKTDRSAYFKTVIVLVENNEEHIFEGIVEGEIGKEPLGENGFGYDVVFIPKGYSRTFAQMSEEEKNHLSHRYNASVKLREFLDKVQ